MLSANGKQQLPPHRVTSDEPPQIYLIADSASIVARQLRKQPTSRASQPTCPPVTQSSSEPTKQAMLNLHVVVLSYVFMYICIYIYKHIYIYIYTQYLPNSGQHAVQRIYDGRCASQGAACSPRPLLAPFPPTPPLPHPVDLSTLCPPSTYKHIHCPHLAPNITCDIDKSKTSRKRPGYSSSPLQWAGSHEVIR